MYKCWSVVGLREFSYKKDHDHKSWLKQNYRMELHAQKCSPVLERAPNIWFVFLQIICKWFEYSIWVQIIRMKVNEVWESISLFILNTWKICKRKDDPLYGTKIERTALASEEKKKIRKSLLFLLFNSLC